MEMFFFKSVHVIAALALFLSFGAIIMAVGFHLVFSYGLAKSGGWWHAKATIALVLGVAPVFVRRKIISPLAASVACMVLGGAAVY